MSKEREQFWDSQEIQLWNDPASTKTIEECKMAIFKDKAEDRYAELKVADDRCDIEFGEGDAFAAICASGRRELFYKDGTDVILLGRGGDFDEAFEQAIPFYERFYGKRSASDRGKL